MPGITVTADNLFCRLLVRRNYYKSANRRKEELDKVKRLGWCGLLPLSALT